MSSVTVSNHTEMSSARLILLACGSFSPPTPMHLRMFEIAKDFFDMMGTYEVIGGIVSPVHDSYGKTGLVHSRHRCAMLKLCLQSSNWIRLSSWEISQPQWSRTRNVLQHHQNCINNFINGSEDEVNEMLPMWLPDGLRRRKDKVKIKLLCGADLLESFSVPGLWLEEDIADIVGNHGIVVISRKGSNPEQFIFDSDILTKYQKNITIITNWVPNEVSSSMVRKLLRRGQSVKYLIDDKIIEYIKRNELYDTKSSKYVSTATEKLFETQNFFNENYINEIISNSPKEIEEMDETDNTRDDRNLIVELSRPKVFCCRGTEITKSTLTRPGQAVQVITNSVDVGKTERNNEMKIKRLKRENSSCD